MMFRKIMLRWFIAVFLLCLPSVWGGFPYISPTKGRPWPLPQSEQPGDGMMTISSDDFGFVATGNDCPILQNAFARYDNIIFSKARHSSSAKKKVKYFEYRKRVIFAGFLTSLRVNVLEPCEDYPHFNMDENYELKICVPDNPTETTLVSQSIWGTLRGLETFSQLVVPDSPTAFVLNCTQILDFPRFPHTGVMLDTSRHYLALTKIQENLDLMAMNKFNVFHWHIVDDQSFPYQSGVYPNLSTEGAWSDIHIYTGEDIAAVIEYARNLGIRVLVEFDTPGHTLSWGLGQPGLLTPCYNWESNPDITAFMDSLAISDDYTKLEEYYITRLVDIVANLPTRNGYIVWEDVFNIGVNIAQDAIVQVWRNGDYPRLFFKELQRVTAAGHKALLSSCWYLDYITYGAEWQKYYECDPRGFSGTREQKRRILGGEACVWGEYIDETNLIQTTWPNAAPVAERLWSPVEATSSADEAAPRLEEHRCRLLSRGYAVKPL